MVAGRRACLHNLDYRMGGLLQLLATLAVPRAHIIYLSSKESGASPLALGVSGRVQVFVSVFPASHPFPADISIKPPPLGRFTTLPPAVGVDAADSSSGV